MTATTQSHDNHTQQGQKLAKDYQHPGKRMTSAHHGPRAVNDTMSEPGHITVSDMVTMQHRPKRVDNDNDDNVVVVGSCLIW